MSKTKELKAAIVTTQNSLNRAEAMKKRRPHIRCNPPPAIIARRAKKEIKRLSQELKEELEQQIKASKIRLEEAKIFQKRYENTVILANPPPASQIMEEEDKIKELNKELQELETNDA